MTKRDALRTALRSLAQDNKPARVEIAEIKQAVFVRRLTLGEVEQQSEDAKSKDRSKLATAVARVLVDEEGTPLYDSTNDDDVLELSKMPWPLISRILDESNKINNLSEEGVTETKKN